MVHVTQNHSRAPSVRLSKASKLPVMLLFLLVGFTSFILLYIGLDQLSWEKLKDVGRVVSPRIPLVGDGDAVTDRSAIALFSEDNIAKSVTIPDAVSALTPLFVITGSIRPWFLISTLFHFFPIRKCFDVHWIIVHSASDRRINKQPLFRDVFPWITELYAFNALSGFSNEERNVGIDFVLQKYQEGFVYFLDDDNTLPMDLCQAGLPNLSTEIMYYADQYSCGQLKNPTARFQSLWTNGTEVNTDFTLVNSADTGHWLTPLSVLRREPSIRWLLPNYDADGYFFTALVKSQLGRNKSDVGIVRLPSVKLHYNELRCERWQAPWSKEELLESLRMYRSVVSDMTNFSESVPTEHKMQRGEVSFHEYVHIVYTLRNYVPTPAATYVEIGVWKGASSIMMSRHPNLTNVIGIDLFSFEHQREEVDAFVHALMGNGTIDIIASESGRAVPELRKILNGRGIDILFIDGDHSVQGARSDFELYSPLVKPGGFICFDDVMDSSMSSGVREAIMELIRDRVINPKDYRFIGVAENVVGAGPVWTEDEFFYDWQNVLSNEFILQKA
jgi:predicted O-methyltransferase YrrM